MKQDLPSTLLNVCMCLVFTKIFWPHEHVAQIFEIFVDF